MTIATCFNYPPIPERSWDWTAYVECQEEDGPTGYGSTEAEAVRSLAEKLAQALAEVQA